MARWIPLFCVLGFGSTAWAQPVIVPAEHPVYGWLAGQRVAGRLPEFRAEALPTDRAAVQRHLDSLQARAPDLGPLDRAWLGTFRDEFFEPPARVHSFVGDGTAEMLDPDAVRTWLFARDSTWRASVWGEGAVEWRAAGTGLSPSGLSRSARLTFEASYRNRVGLYTSTLAGVQVTGDPQVLASDPDLAPLYYVARDPRNVSGPFDRTSASARVVGGPFAAEIANQRLRLGASADAPIVLADGADYVPHVRLSLRTRSVTVEAIHAALSSRAVQVAGDDGDRVITAPERYLAVQRLGVHPTGWWSVGYTGMVVYGRRGPELAYLNPLVPFKTAEHALYDRDNSLFAIETIVRPAPGAETYLTVLIDDMDGGTLGDGRYGNKWAIQGGVQTRVPRTTATAFAEYVRIEPYTYTHRFREDGFFYNAYVHNGFGLGHPLGPNADQVLAGVQAWGPLRSRLRLSGGYVRKGENPVDPVTGAVTQVGGDVRLGTAPEDGTKTFLSGDVYRGPRLTGDLQLQPARWATLAVAAEVQFWDRRETDVFVRVGLVVRP